MSFPLSRLRGALLSFALPISAAQALAGPALSTSAAPANFEAVGEDVVASARKWLSGDQSGRTDLEALAARGRSDAQEMLGELMGASGPPALRDEIAACGWHGKSAGSRADSLHNSALCAEKGVGGEPDLPRAAKLYERAAERGYAKSMCALGNLYVAGRGTPKDQTKGAAFCQRGAELGDRDAQTDLGNLYLQGVGVPRDIVQARKWYELAAAQGQPNASFVLGQIYWNGDGVQRDRSKASELWRAAYQGGRVDAAPLLAAWLFSSWMSAHPRGDVSLLDEAIGYQQVAVRTAAAHKQSEQETALTLKQTARTAASKER